MDIQQGHLSWFSLMVNCKLSYFLVQGLAVERITHM